jgi:hypothetical protein
MHTKTLPALKSENYWREKLKELNEAALGQVGALRAATNAEIQQVQAKIKALQDLGKIQEQQQFKNLNQWQSQSGLPSAMGEKVAKPGLSNVGEWIAGIQATSAALQEKTDKENAAAAASANHADKMYQQTMVIAGLAEAFGAGFGEMISGAQSFAQSMKSMANNVVNELYRVAQMQLIAKSAALGPWGLAAATAGLAALRGLVGGLLSSGGNTGGGAGYQSSNNANAYRREADNLRVTFDAPRLEGPTLVWAIKKASYQNGKTGG